ncbi:hypothetical protein J2S43_005322 [Catenuloplanes nepalensis]|uniref:Transposase IS4 N-terminal domain-containing protein n=1 Tax=Catenuloplanes nepalensis TaxID=587533 RepID=A0ABT9MZF0_9ACTN|nr:transposase domain-containing protein [Catenuloplanes nepalensis]MDP9796810.1 hypothetical protein [Catenuloplanes nepalensis]
MAGEKRDGRAARDTVPDRVAIGVLVTRFPPALVDGAIDAAGARERRRRALPARLTAYLTMAMWLWRDHGYEDVLLRLADGLRWSGAEPDTTDAAGSGSIAKARARLGSEPLRLLLAATADPATGPRTPGSRWHGLRLTAVDGATVEVPGSPANRAGFGAPPAGAGPAANPRVRLLAHADCGTGALLNADFDGDRTGPAELADRLLGSFGPGMLVLAGPDVLSWRLWRAAAATGAELAWHTGDAIVPPVGERLPDGSYLSVLRPPRPGDGEPVTVRVIEREPVRLVTTLLDARVRPATEFAAFQHGRWRAERVLDAVRSGPRGTAVLARSQSPDGVRQEIWALLCLYQALVPLTTQP